ncbi:Long-chain fatty acid transport protein [Dirofilaria immitis]
MKTLLPTLTDTSVFCPLNTQPEMHVTRKTHNTARKVLHTTRITLAPIEPQGHTIPLFHGTYTRKCSAQHSTPMQLFHIVLAKNCKTLSAVRLLQPYI